jgi:NAD(P)-dependent dehydrogenase (short-subunit alcohol dehydrogenase family)
MNGKTVVMTGATSGIGAAAALALAGQGARVVFTARDPDRAKATRDRLVRANPDAAHDFVLADLTSLADMRTAGDALRAKAPRVDVLINNAGAIFQSLELTVDGLEKTFAVDHMAYFVITERLMTALNPGARIVSTASVAHTAGRLDLDDLAMTRGYSAFGAYGRAKLCNILWTRELARRLEGREITANCFHPGGVNTGFGDNLTGLAKTAFGVVKRFMLTPEQGADTLVWLAASPDPEGISGGYFAKRKLVQPSAAARDDALAARLWVVSERLASGAPAPA